MNIYFNKQLFFLFTIIITVFLLIDSGNLEATVIQRIIFVLFLLFFNINRGIEVNILDILVISFLTFSLGTNIYFKTSPFLTLHTLSPLWSFFLYVNLKWLYMKKNKDEIISMLLRVCSITVILLNVLYLLCYNKNIINNPIPFVNTSLTSNFLSLTASCLIAIHSRTSYIAIYSVIYTIVNKARIAIIVFLMVLFSMIKVKNYVKVVAALLLFVLLFFIKIDSSSGRFLIMKVSLSRIETVIFRPIGYGEFANWYLPHQSEYLNQIEKTKLDFLLADNSEFVFNDFIQLFIEVGFIGLGVFLMIFVFAFKYIKKFRPKYNFTDFLIYYIFISCFSYILYVDLFVFILLSVIAYISSCQEKSILHISKTTMLILKCVLSPFIVFNLYWHYNPNYRLDGIAVPLLIHPEYKVYDEAYRLAIKKQYSEALYLLDKIEPVSFDADLLLLKAKCYEETFDMGNASKYYNETCKMLPNKFKPKYHLFQFLKKNNMDASNIAKDILETPIKINSKEIENLKKEAHEYINRESDTKRLF